MKFRDLVAACLTGVLLLPVGCADEKLKMEVPDTDTAVFTQMEQTNLEEWNNAQTEKVLEMPLVRRDVERAAGGTIPLYALDTGEEPAAGTDQITSVSAALVLNSSAVWLGEYGAVRDLAESELYHWADASDFDHIQYTQPMQLSESAVLCTCCWKTIRSAWSSWSATPIWATAPHVWIVCGTHWQMGRRMKTRMFSTKPPQHC